MRLTKAYINKAIYKKAGNGQDIRWDSATPGFGLRLYPTGRKSFVLRYKDASGRRTIVLGNAEDMDLDDARRKAEEMLLRVRTGTLATLTVRHSVAGLEFSELVKTYIKRYARHARSGYEDVRRINKHFLPRWADAKVHEIKGSDLAKLHEEISKTGQVEANRVLQLFSRIFNRGKEWKLIPPELDNPCNEVIENPERKRDRYVSTDEMPKLLRAIAKVSNPHVRAALRLYLLIGCRKNELLRATWDDLDHSMRQLRLRDTKNGSTHWQPLGEHAYQLLCSLPRKDGNPYIFPGKNEGQPIVNFEK